MTREELEHLIRASAAVTDEYEFVIVGSQSILGALPNAAAEFTMSAEADIYPLQAPELADRIDGALGEGSQFTKPMATTRKAWGRTLRFCQKAGCNACTVCRALPRKAVWATAST